MSKTNTCFCGRVFVRGRDSLGKFCSVECYRAWEQVSPLELRLREARDLPVKEKREWVVSESDLVSHKIIYNPVLSKATSMKLLELSSGKYSKRVADYFEKVNLIKA